MGADFYTTKKAIVGLALTYVIGDVTANPIDTVINNKTKYYGISFYDRITNGNSAWTYDLGYSQGTNEISQNSYQTITADAKTNAYTLGVKYEHAYNFKHSALVPFASLRYLRLSSNDYSNSTYDVQYDTVDKSSYYTKLGLNFNKRNFTGGVSYRYAKGDAARQNSWNVNLNWSF